VLGVSTCTRRHLPGWGAISDPSSILGCGHGVEGLRFAPTPSIHVSSCPRRQHQRSLDHDLEKCSAMILEYAKATTNGPGLESRGASSRRLLRRPPEG